MSWSAIPLGVADTPAVGWICGLLFILALATALSAEGGLTIRLIGYALALLSTLVKYYPLVTLVILVEEGIPVFLLVSAAVVLSLTIFGVAYHDEIARTLPYIPHGGYIEGFFGA